MAIEIKVAPDVSLSLDLRFTVPLQIPCHYERTVHRRLIVFKGVHHYNFRPATKQTCLVSKSNSR